MLFLLRNILSISYSWMFQTITLNLISVYRLLYRHFINVGFRKKGKDFFLVDYFNSIQHIFSNPSFVYSAML